MIVPEYDLGDIIETKKPHPCASHSTMWTITRMGADIKMQCHGCGAIIMMTRQKFEKRLKRVVEHHEGSEE